jgi:hypothetical protein
MQAAEMAPTEYDNSEINAVSKESADLCPVCATLLTSLLFAETESTETSAL